MMWHFHNFGRWADVAVEEVVQGPPMMVSVFILPVQVIKQQRRCAVCNLVETRRS